MKILIFTPYINTLGGGERYVFTVAGYFLAQGGEVYLAWEDESVIMLKSE